MKSEIDAHLNTRCYIELFPDNKKNMQAFLVLDSFNISS